MADVPPPSPNPIPPSGPTGALPPKKETGKVQPKKETVRINLPPKPTAAPTIKLPTLPPGGPTGAPSAPIIAAAPAPPKTAGTPTPAPAPALTRPAAAAPAAQQRPAPVTQRPAPVVPTIKALDKVLIYTSVVASLVAIAGVGWVYYTLKTATDTFTQ